MFCAYNESVCLNFQFSTIHWSLNYLALFFICERDSPCGVGCIILEVGFVRRPTALQDRTRDSDDDDYQDRDYDVAALANNLSQAFRYGIYSNDDMDEVLFNLISPSLLSIFGHHSFRPNLSGHISIRSSLSLSFRSSVPVLRAKGENAFRSVESSSENTHRRQLFRRTFPANFPATVFFYTARSAWRRSPICPKAPEPETHPRAAHARFSGRRLHLTRRRVRAREPLSGDALPPPGSPDADQPPFYLFVQSEPCTCLFWVPARALGSVLLPFRSMTKYGMASSQVSSVTSPESGGRSEIPNLGGNDSSPILITGHKLNGHNYLQWSQSVLLFICGKGKDEYLTGEAVMPETTEPGFRKWKIENSMIMSWLINSMNNDIGENFLLFGTAKDIWDAAKETYSSSENTSELFQVESALHDFRQGEQSVTQYYNTLTSNIQANCGTKETVQVLPRTKQGIG
ncbi:hypothetical protein CK203_026890 [Vitis vinifera]|uniref:Retrotransposon gag domain-containing protein n=1 Tax=Vitis vinifera TaxID=29760 RepID=A0A438IP84_VITVI|nr:hypothetical protein CK203_026890 [Vitis vinifera]